jgi:L-cysteine:1D-myo-inositol 2-amino-2-deoxy-alpha-D-glucopyranoside ligase
MRLYDTRTRGLVPLTLGHTVRVYACGITPYAASHLGHAFVYTVFDVLVRTLERDGHRVRYVRNVTDVDDDILRTARERGVDYLELGRRETAQFDEELVALNLRRPDAEPRATQMIGPMRTAIRGLLDLGGAYALADGRVYFDVRRAGRSWGALSRLGPQEMLRRFAENGGDPDAPGKRSALDLLLWQPSGPGEPSWPSDWGAGRPGWHLECSVMVMEELGSTIDIHGGGSDLVFPHHEAEIVQSEYLTGQAPFSRVWLHVGLVALDGVKMSKSLGNLVFVDDLRARFPGGAIRRYLLEHHYRSNWEYDEDALKRSAVAHASWTDVARSAGRRPDLEAQFADALRDDLDTPAAVELLDQAAAAGAGETVRNLADALGTRLDAAYPEALEA